MLNSPHGQVSDVFNRLETGIHAAVVTRDTPLRMQSNTACIVGTPKHLDQDFGQFGLVNCTSLVFDEADVLLESHQSETLCRRFLQPNRIPIDGSRNRLLKALARHPVNWKDVDLPNSPVDRTQVVFVAATLPARGFKSQFAALMYWFPHVVFIRNEG